MQNIQIFRVNKYSSRAMIIFGILILIFGLTGLIFTIKNGFNMHIFGDWIYFIHVLQGLFFMKWGYSRLMMGRYYIEWDDHILRYLIPDNQEPVEIPIADIKSVNFAHFGIIIQLREGDKKIITLKEVQTREYNQIRHKFNEIKELCPSV